MFEQLSQKNKQIVLIVGTGRSQVDRPHLQNLDLLFLVF